MTGEHVRIHRDKEQVESLLLALLLRAGLPAMEKSSFACGGGSESIGENTLISHTSGNEQTREDQYIAAFRWTCLALQISIRIDISSRYASSKYNREKVETGGWREIVLPHPGIRINTFPLSFLSTHGG